MAVTEIKSYDPEGDQTENDDTLHNLIDDKESTSWSTELYKSAAFGNLKDGVGLEFTLETPATIMEIVSTVDGWNGELRQDTTSGSAAKIIGPGRHEARSSPCASRSRRGVSGSPS